LIISKCDRSLTSALGSITMNLKMISNVKLATTKRYRMLRLSSVGKSNAT